MGTKAYRAILDLIRQAARLAREIGIPNLLQPGLVKEMMIADILGHELIHSKRDADAHHRDDRSIKYEYLSCKEGGSGQLDRMFKEPATDREKSLERIRRNSKIYLAVFYATDQMRCKAIYELEPLVVLREAERQLDRSKNRISHVAFSIRWAKKYGEAIWQDQQPAPGVRDES